MTKSEKIILTSRQGREILLEIKAGRIDSIENNSGVRFPFSVGQPYSMSIKSWAQNNNFKWNGEDIENEKRIFGVKIKDVPPGHEWRYMFPNKFR